MSTKNLSRYAKVGKKRVKSLGAAYNPKSKGCKVLNVSVPDSMAFETETALEQIRQEVGGDLVNYVADRCGYESRKQLCDALAAEQIDAVAMSIYNIEVKKQGCIIGDQTGIGKGRQAAALIKYAKHQNKMAIFFTEKPNLFSDIYRDLIAIGAEDGSQVLKIANGKKEVEIKYKDWDKLSEEEKEEYNNSEEEYLQYQEENPTEEVFSYIDNKSKYDLKKGKHIIPFVVNARNDKTDIKDEEGNVIYQPLPDNQLKSILNSGELPKNFDVILSTYSQIALNPVDKKTKKLVGRSVKSSFLTKMAKNAILILDEAHNAAGNSNTKIIMNEILGQSDGCLFLSATFSKRPENMGIFAAKTCMQDAGLSDDKIAETITDGGVAMQEVISSLLVKNGQMLRRERTFEGIQVDYIYLDKEGAKKYGVRDAEKQHLAIADKITDIITDIIDFQTNFINQEIEKLDGEIIKTSGRVEKRKGTKEAGVSNTPYFNKIFQVINQMLFSIKANDVANEAIEQLKNGKKPVIAFSSTMETFINEIGKPGETVPVDFSVVLQKGLESVMRYTVIDDAGNRTYEQFDIESFSLEAQLVYTKILAKIKNTVSGIVLSPIDLVIQKIEAAGYKVMEVTGRKKRIQLNLESIALDVVKMPMGIILDRKPTPVNDAFRMFQNNQVDVLLINQSGSTGASAHAIPTKLVPASEVKPRVMLFLQPELDITRQVQKMGRINRTGQLHLPAYIYLSSAIPAEKRMMMMLQRKLRSLDANTTANQKNSSDVLDVADFLNEYGDKIVYQWLLENPVIKNNLGLGESTKNKKDAENNEREKNVEGIPKDFAYKVSGRVAILQTVKQAKFYNEVLEAYNQYVNNLKQTGDYNLEMENLDLQAKLINEELAEGGTGGDSDFGKDVMLGEYSVINLKKPFAKEEIKALISTAKAGRQAKNIQDDLIKEMKDFKISRALKEIEELKKDYATVRANVKNESKIQKIAQNKRAEAIQDRLKEINEAEAKAISNVKTKANNQAEYLENIFKFFPIGKQIAYREFAFSGDSVLTKGVCLGFTINRKKDNPFAPSSISVRFAFASTLKMLDLVLSGDQGKLVDQIKGNTPYFYNQEQADKDLIDNWNDIIKEASAPRKTVFIATGNVFLGFKKFSEEKGKLVSFTLANGEIKKGILMPDNWKSAAVGKQQYVTVPVKYAWKYLNSLRAGYATIDLDGLITVSRANDSFIRLNVNKSRQTGGTIYLDQDVLKLVQDNNFNSSGTVMQALVANDNIKAICQVLSNKFKLKVAIPKSTYLVLEDEINAERKKDNSSTFIVKVKAVKEIPETAASDKKEALKEDNEEDDYEYLEMEALALALAIEIELELYKMKKSA